MKLFKTSNIDVINDCRDMFDIKLPSVQLSQRFDVFIAKWVYTVSHKNGANLVFSVTSSNVNKS